MKSVRLSTLDPGDVMAPLRTPLYANEWQGGGASRQDDFLSSLQVPVTTLGGHGYGRQRGHDTFLSSWHGHSYSDVRSQGHGAHDIRIPVKQTMSLSGVREMWNTLKDSLRGRLSSAKANQNEGSAHFNNGNIEEIMENLDHFSFSRTYQSYDSSRKWQGHTLTGGLSPFFVPRKESDVWNNICDLFWRPGLSFCRFEWGSGQLTPWGELWARGGTLRGLLMDSYGQADLGGLEVGEGRGFGVGDGALHEEDRPDRELLELLKLVLRCGPVRVLRNLLQLGIVDVNILLGEAGGLLHVACVARNFDVITFLCTTGIDPRLKDCKGRFAGQMTFTADTRRLLPTAYLTNAAPLAPPGVCSNSDRRSIFDMARDPHQLDELLIRLQVLSFDVNKEMNDEGDLLIHAICKQGVKQGAALMLLVQKFGAMVNAFSRQGYTPLMLAVLSASDVMAQLLVCVLGADPNCCEENTGYTACHLAANYNYFDILGSLIRRGADFNVEGKDGRLPDDVATVACANECAEIIRQERHKRIANLKDKILNDTLRAEDLRPSDVITPDEDDVTLLIFAVQHNSINSIESLLSFKETPRNAQDPKTGQTAMMIAAAHGHDGALRLLLNSGCDPRIRDMEQMMTIHHAVRGRHLPCVSVLLTSQSPVLTGLQRAIEMTDCPKIKALLQQAKFRRQVETIRPILWKSAVSGDDAALYQILEEGDDVYAGSNSRTENPIYLAASNGHLEVLKLLLQHGGDIMGYYGNASSSLLHVACQYGHTDIAHHVLNVYRMQLTSHEKQKIINSSNRYGKTALQLAADTGRAELVSLLIQEGASTALVDYNGNLYQCEQYEGIQYMIETARRFHTTAVINAVLAKKMDALKQIWMPRLDHNLRDLHGDTPLMVTVRQGTSFLPVLQFLLASAVFESDESPANPGSSAVSKSPSRWRQPYGVLLGEKAVKVPLSVEPSEDVSVDSAFELDEGIIEDQEMQHAEQSSEGMFSDHAESLLSKDVSRMSSLFHSFTLPNHVFQSGGRVSHVCAQNLRDGQTALHYAIRLPDGTPVAVALLRADPAILHIPDRTGLTPLHLACKLGKADTVRLLLSQPEVDVNARTLEGQLPDELTKQPVILKALQSARAPPPGSYGFNNFADNASRPGSTSGASVDFEALNTRFQLVKRRQKKDLDGPPSYKP